MSNCPPRNLKPFFKKGCVTIYCGDCLKIIPQLDSKFDWCVTDPPYGTQGDGGYGRTQIHGRNGRRIKNDESLDTFQKILALLKPENICSFCSPKKVAEMMECFGLHNLIQRHEFIWNKKTPGLGAVRYTHESIFIATKNELDGKKSNGSIFDGIAPARKNTHPHEKPINVVGSILDILKPASVIDPFMGTGVMAIACAERGISYVGIEIEHKYCQLAVERLKQDLLF